MKDYPFERNVPIAVKHMGGREPKYPRLEFYAAMKPGDSVLIPYKDFPNTSKRDLVSRVSNPISRLNRHKHFPGRVYVVRRTPDGVRVWRVQ